MLETPHNWQFSFYRRVGGPIPETRGPKSERSPKLEIRIYDASGRALGSAFGLRTSFGFRPSDFRFTTRNCQNENCCGTTTFHSRNPRALPHTPALFSWRSARDLAVYLEAAVDLAAFSAGRAHAAGLAGPRLSHDALPPTLGRPPGIAGNPCEPGGSVWLAPGPLETALAARAIIPVANHLPGGVCPRAGRRRPRARN